MKKRLEFTADSRSATIGSSQEQQPVTGNEFIDVVNRISKNFDLFLLSQGGWNTSLLMNKEFKLSIQKGPKGYLKIVDAAGNHNNEGMLCLCHGHIWFKDKELSSRYLIGEIKGKGLDVTKDEHFLELAIGSQPCVGGTGYKGALSFPEAQDEEKNSKEILAPAIGFLKKFYRVSEID